MSMRILALVVACALQIMPGAAETQRSCRPFIYVIDYSDKWVQDATAADSFGEQPPDVLHIGKSVPITHNWGAIPYMAGENQQTGGPGHTLSRDNVRLLSPAELEAKIKAITAAVVRLHEAGIPTVMPYICNFTMAGDHETREGLWAFYDRWDEYSPWLGPRPPTGPTDWMTKDASGKRIDPGYGFTPSYYEPLHRYMACTHNPSWNQFSRAIVRLIAQCGYDGVFVDNSNSGGDGCPYCEAAFGEWVGRHFDEESLRLACGVDEVGDISLSNRALAPVIARWKSAAMRDRLKMLRQAGEEIRPGFQIFPNVGQYQKVHVYGDGCDLFMFESVKSPGYLLEDEPPESLDALVTVTDDVEVDMTMMPYEAIHSEVFSEVTAEVRFPRACSPGEEAPVQVNVLSVGASNLDGDCLRAMELRFTHATSGEQQTVRLGPLPGVGSPDVVQGAQRPPVTLEGTWTPAAPGPYAVDVRYHYTDAEHLDVTDDVLVRDRLAITGLYRVSLGGLACSFGSGCKTVSLDYEHTREGRQRIQELSLAEGAAAGGRHAANSRGEPLRKYARFFRDYGDRLGGLTPYARVKLLYAYWGGNPGQVGRGNTRTVQEVLSREHILYHGIVDQKLNASDLDAKVDTLILVCNAYDLSDEQVGVLRRFVEAGGRLIMQHEQTSINFRPIAQVMGDAMDKVQVWDWDEMKRGWTALCADGGRLQGVRFTAFAEPVEPPERLILHVVNYNVSLAEATMGELTPIEGLTVRVPVPDTWEGAEAVVYDPDTQAPATLECGLEDATARIALPTLSVYQVVELTRGG